MSDLLPVLLSDIPAMTNCSICPKPGSCCSGFTVNFGDAYTADWEAEATKKLQEYGLPFVVSGVYISKEHFRSAWHPIITGTNLNRVTGESVHPLYSCTKLLPNGRCGIYETRPQLCRLFVPGSDGLCVFPVRPRTGLEV